jgi:hypothetical protein
MPRRINLELDGFDMQTEHNGTQEAAPDSTDSGKAQVGDFSADHFLDQVPPEALEEPMWYCDQYLERALSKTDDYDMQDLRQMLADGRAHLLIEFAGGRPQGCVVACVQRLTTGSAMHIMAIAGLPGKDFRYPNTRSFELLAAKGRAWGCNCVQGFAIESVARLWSRIEFKEVARLMRKSI